MNPDDSADQATCRKPRLVPTLVLIAAIAAGLGSVAAFIQLKVQYDILRLADHTSQILLPDIQIQVRAALNLERLKVFGEVIRSSPEPRERRESLLAIRVMAMNTAYDKNAAMTDQVNQIYQLAERMTTYRNQQDTTRRRIEIEQARLDSGPQLHESSESTTYPPLVSVDEKTAELRSLMPELRLVLQNGLTNPRSATTRIALSTLEQRFKDYQARFGPSSDPLAERIQRLLQFQRQIFDAEDALTAAWTQARAILGNLTDDLSVDAAIAASEGSFEIARYAKYAMFAVAITFCGLILLFTAGIYFFRWAIINPIIRVTADLQRVKITRSPVRPRREQLRELDDIATAVEAFGGALAQISERTLELEREVAERKKAQAQLLELATTDSLTGLRNRRYFFEFAKHEFERARRYHMPLALLLLDADHFKIINDRYGHPVGDLALQVLAATGQQLLREVDLFARIGGEEFAILLPQTEAKAAWMVAERLRLMITQQAIATDLGPLHLTVSLGLASLGPAIADLNALLRQADTALYQAKQNGRNRVEPLPADS